MIRTTQITIELEWAESNCDHPLLWKWADLLELEFVRVVDAHDSAPPRDEGEHELGGEG